jgi:hypothetical protein
MCDTTTHERIKNERKKRRETLYGNNHQRPEQNREQSFKVGAKFNVNFEE